MGILNKVENSNLFGKGFNNLSQGMKSGLSGIASAAGGAVGSAISGGLESGAGKALDGLGNLASAIPGPWGMVASAGLKTIGGVVNAAFGSKLNEENIAEVNNNINQMNNFKANASSFDDLNNLASNLPATMGFDLRFIGKDGWFATKAKDKFDELKAKLDRALGYVDNSIANNALNLSSALNSNLSANYAAEGGFLGTNGADWDLGIREVNTGGSHEENPYSGIPMGTDDLGMPNLVEEGEVIYNDYVFSKRLKLNKLIANDNLLAKKYVGKSYADIAKDILKYKKEMPNDPINKNTLGILMSRLLNALELLRMLQEAEKQQLAQILDTDLAIPQDQLMLEVPEEMMLLQDPYELKMQEQMMLEQMRNNIQQELTPQLFDEGGELSPSMKPLKDDYKSTDFSAPTDFLVPWYDRKLPPLQNSLLGTSLDRSLDTETVKPIQLNNTLPPLKIPKEVTVPKLNLGLQDYINKIGDDKIKGTISEYFNKNPLRYNQNISKPIQLEDTWMRHAPVIGSAIGVEKSLLSRPDHSNADRIEAEAKNLSNYDRVAAPVIGDYIKYTPQDTMYGVNNLNALAGSTRRALANTGAIGSRAAGILAADNNYIGNVGDYLLKSWQANNAENQKVNEYNRETNKYIADNIFKASAINLGAKEKALALGLNALLNSINMRDTIDTNRSNSISANLTNFFNNLGGLGKEAYSRNMIVSSPQFYYTIDSKGGLSYKGLESLTPELQLYVKNAAEADPRRKS